MYVKVYRYKIKKNALREWKRTAGKAAKIYKGYGDKGKWLVIMKKEKNFVSVIDMSIYKTKGGFLKIKKKTDRDKMIKHLYLTFKETLYSKGFVEEDFEVLKS